MKSGQVICKALVDGKSYKDIHKLLQASHPTGKAALTRFQPPESLKPLQNGFAV